MFGGFSGTKLKTHLKMAGTRIQIHSNKKTALLKQNMREVAVLLAEDPPKEEMASIKAEALIRDDNTLEALEIIQLECEMLHERIKLIEFSKTCPADLVSVVSTLIWASHRVDIPELINVRKQFRAKFGKIFEEDALINKGNILNERVVAKLSIQPPAAYLVQCYLERICEQFEVDWQPKIKLDPSQMAEPMAAPNGYSVGAGQGTGLRAKPIQPPTELPVAVAQPFGLPRVPVQKSDKSELDDIQEADIYIPPLAPTIHPSAPQIPPTAPSFQPASATFQPSAPTFHIPQDQSYEGKNNDEDENNNNSSESGGPTYQDLAARFNDLKKL